MKPFNLKEYLANPNKKVITRDGNPVRIICTDHDNISYPIIGTIKGYKFPFCFSEDGYVVGSKCNDANDLFFAPEKHEGWINLYKNEDGISWISPNYFTSKKEAEEEVKIHTCSVTTIKIEWEEDL